jgi:hypothetical protein
VDAASDDSLAAVSPATSHAPPRAVGPSHDVRPKSPLELRPLGVSLRLRPLRGDRLAYPAIDDDRPCHPRAQGDPRSRGCSRGAERRWPLPPRRRVRGPGSSVAPRHLHEHRLSFRESDEARSECGAAPLMASTPGVQHRGGQPWSITRLLPCSQALAPERRSPVRPVASPWSRSPCRRRRSRHRPHRRPRSSRASSRMMSPIRFPPRERRAIRGPRPRQTGHRLPAVAPVRWRAAFDVDRRPLGSSRTAGAMSCRRLRRVPRPSRCTGSRLQLRRARVAPSSPARSIADPGACRGRGGAVGIDSGARDGHAWAMRSDRCPGASHQPWPQAPRAGDRRRRARH